MKYALLTILALAIGLAAGAFLTRLITRGRNTSRPLRILLSVVFCLLLIVGAGIGFFLPYAHAEPEALAALESDPTVTVTHARYGYVFDGPGADTAYIFNPGAKVDSAAYAPLLRGIAEDGTDCVLLEAPLHAPFFSINKTDTIIRDFPHAHWYVGGHSLGGVTASSFAVKHTDQIDGIILLASYPTAKVPEGQRLCSIYGDRDTVLDIEAYNKARPNFPADASEHCLKGANHAGFACYGRQRGDSPAKISPERQRELTREAIRSFLAE